MKGVTMEILIVGAGIAGLSLALALKNKGVSVDIVERKSKGLQIGAGLYLPGNATRAFGELGLQAELTKIATPILRQRFLDQRGVELSAVDTSATWSSCGDCLAVRRSELHTILETAFENPIKRGEIVSLSNLTNGTHVRFSDGETARYDLVVGADGLNSSIRRLAFGETPPCYVGNVCWRFVTKNHVGIDAWTAMVGGGRTLLAVPLTSSEVYVYADIAVGEEGSAALDMRSPLPTLFAGFGGPIMPLIDAPIERETIHFGRINQVKLQSWVERRVVLVGDAAHASSPSMAQGAGMAVEDSLILAEELTASENTDQALQNYEMRRRPRVNWVQKQCEARDRIAHPPQIYSQSDPKVSRSLDVRS